MSPSQHQRDEAALPDSLELFRSIFEHSVTGIAVISASGRFLRVNGALCAMLGYGKDELQQRTFQEISHPDYVESADAFLQLILSGELKTPTREQRGIAKSGAPVWMQIDATLVESSSGSFECIVLVMHDITRHKLAEETLKKSEDRFRRMVELGSDWYWEQDENYRFVDLPGLERKHLDPEPVIGKTRWEIPDIAPLPEEVWRRHKAVLDRREPFSDFVFMRYDKSGELRYLSTTGEPVYDEEGKFRGYNGICKDVTEQVHAQRALEESEERYRTLFEVHPHPMWVVDSKSLAFLAVNDAAIRHYGYSREEFLAMTVEQIRPDEEVPKLLLAFADQSSSYMRRLWRHKKKSGELIDVELIAFNLEFDGRPARLGVVTDVTEQLKAEERARESEERYLALLQSRAAPPGSNP
jgi:PAS domain S-box-containing protein